MHYNESENINSVCTTMSQRNINSKCSTKNQEITQPKCTKSQINMNSLCTTMSLRNINYTPFVSHLPFSGSATLRGLS